MFLQEILIILAVVWLTRKVFQFIHLPPLFGEIFAGVIVGPLILGAVSETESITLLAELGVFFLMFHSGLESDPSDLFKSFKSAVLVALGSVLFAFGGAYTVASLFGYESSIAFFIGLSATVTAVVISTRLFKDYKFTDSRVAHITMAAAIMIEVTILIIFSVFMDVQQSGSFDTKEIILTLCKTVSYFAIILFVGKKWFKYLYKIVYRGNKGYSFTIIIAMAFAVLAEMAGLHFIIGAYFAGLFLHEGLVDADVFEKIEDRVYGLSYSFLGPIFFATLAFHLSFDILSEQLGFVLIILGTIIGMKILGASLAAYFATSNRLEALAIGIAMNSQGAVELIIATIGLKAGVINEDIFSLLVFIAFSTTLFSIIAIKPLIQTLKKREVTA